ncbi:MAG TPA: VTT domain-containing protein [Vicinamibacterales bacterium]|nr:VTT domain-containing protein [Vicinamibacterales bacterium]
MQRLVAFFQPLAQGFGGAGLALVTFLDSSFLSLPEIADLAIVWLVIQNPARWWYYALASTAGSVAGCYVLYALARKGGEAFLRKRFHERHVDRGLAAFRRYGLLALVVPSLMPPPMPFKIFILLAGVADVSPGTFLAALTFGRGVRYGGEALLAYFYGQQATDFIREHLAQVSLWLAGAIALAGVIYVVWRRRRNPTA